MANRHYSCGKHTLSGNLDRCCWWNRHAVFGTPVQVCGVECYCRNDIQIVIVHFNVSNDELYNGKHHTCWAHSSSRKTFHLRPPGLTHDYISGQGSTVGSPHNTFNIIRYCIQFYNCKGNVVLIYQTHKRHHIIQPWEQAMGCLALNDLVRPDCLTTKPRSTSII